MAIDSVNSVLQGLMLYLRHHEILALFVILFVEEAGVPLPAPGDLLIMLAGYRASRGDVGLLQAALAVTLGVQMGSSLLYLVARRLGRNLLFKYGKFMRLEKDKLDRAEEWTKKRGAPMVFIGRLTPGLRVPSSLMAGVFGIPFHSFLLYTTLSAISWCAVWMASGYYFGKQLVPLVEQLDSSAGPVAIVVVGLAVVAFVTYKRMGGKGGNWRNLARPTDRPNA